MFQLHSCQIWRKPEVEKHLFSGSALVLIITDQSVTAEGSRNTSDWPDEKDSFNYLSHLYSFFLKVLYGLFKRWIQPKSNTFMKHSS